MIPYRVDPEDGSVETSLSGMLLIDHPLLNKGSAFSEEERREFSLEGLLPPHVSTLEEQLLRTYNNYLQKTTDLEKYVFLLSLQDRNETLFYALLERHVEEMMPIIYTPVVGAASQEYSHIYRRPRGLFLPFPEKDRLEILLENAATDPDVIVVTDGERILGLGDLGLNGMGIPVGKLALYTLCAGIHPAKTLPILLDVGTDNKELLADPLYLGWRHERVRGKDYDDFIEAFVTAVVKKFPKALLQWEDFSKNNAPRILEKYRDRLCTFNDDIQGTGAVTLAGWLAASSAAGIPLKNHRVVILGAGSAATGIAGQIQSVLRREGLSPAEALSSVWLVDSRGLVHDGRGDLESGKRVFAQPAGKIVEWSVVDRGKISLGETVKNLRPTALIGTSAQPGAFTEGIVRDMARHASRPVVFPLSNPTSKSEADPKNILAWTEGRAFVATGSPYPAVEWGGKSIPIGQCNNAYIFPGVGLGVTASGARRVTDAMFIAAAEALSALSPARREPGASLFPPLENIREVSRRVARAVALEAVKDGVADPVPTEKLEEKMAAAQWEPRYKLLRKISR